jgi:hypothetical protein
MYPPLSPHPHPQSQSQSQSHSFLFIFFKIRPAIKKRNILTWKQKLGMLEELDEGFMSFKACSRNHYSPPKRPRNWRLQRAEALATAANKVDAISRHAFLSKKTVHIGRKSKTGGNTLDNVLTM